MIASYYYLSPLPLSLWLYVFVWAHLTTCQMRYYDDTQCAPTRGESDRTDRQCDVMMPLLCVCVWAM